MMLAGVEVHSMWKDRKTTFSAHVIRGCDMLRYSLEQIKPENWINVFFCYCFLSTYHAPPTKKGEGESQKERHGYRRHINI